MASVTFEFTSNTNKTLDFRIQGFIEEVIAIAGAVGGAATLTLEIVEDAVVMGTPCNAVALTASGKTEIAPRKKAKLNDGTTERGDAWYYADNRKLKATLAGAAGTYTVSVTVNYTEV